MICYDVRRAGPPIFPKNGDSYVLLNGKALGIFNKLEISRALLAFLRIFTNSYSTLWAPQNDILK